MRHATMYHVLEPSLVQGGEQHTGITVAHIGFPSGRLLQPIHGRFNHAAGTVTSTREPHRVVALVVSDIEESLRACFVVAGEMALRSEALRVENDLRRSVGVQRPGQHRYPLSNFGRHARSRRDHADPTPSFAHPCTQPTLHVIGNPSRFCQWPTSSKITFFAALGVVE